MCILHSGCLAYKCRLPAVGITKVEEVRNGISSRNLVLHSGCLAYKYAFLNFP